MGVDRRRSRGIPSFLNLSMRRHFRARSWVYGEVCGGIWGLAVGTAGAAAVAVPQNPLLQMQMLRCARMASVSVSNSSHAYSRKQSEKKSCMMTVPSMLFNFHLCARVHARVS